MLSLRKMELCLQVPCCEERRVLQVKCNMKTGAMLVVFFILWAASTEALDTCECILKYTSPVDMRTGCISS
jgi:hypothetical protein